MSFEAILGALDKLPVTPLSGTAFRAVNLRHINSPLSAVGSVRVGGRFNRRGLFEALYLSENPETTLREVEFGASVDGIFKAVPKEPYVIFSIGFSLSRIVDLSLPEAWRILGVTREQLTAPWRKKQLFGEPILTQAIWAKALELGLEALKFVSATDGQVNLAVFPANLRGGNWLEIGLEGRGVHRLP
ncbi:MAG: RES family NAD+ phosphorylase [Thermaceae bacterium]|nr:RES family NAD+ phosphorylase [Thermaceae bacterium]